jgi:negative regulator of sigma E activity
MSQLTKLGIAAAAVIVAVVLFVLLRPDGDDGDEASPTPATETTGTSEAAQTNETTIEETSTQDTTTAETTTTGPQPERISVRFQDGEVVGGIKEVDVDRNQQVVVLVQSDVADEVHVHGYNLSAEVAPGQPTRIAFDADVVGRFEIELEDRALQLVDLRVRP